MHPINSRNFGKATNKIAVKFNNGSAVVIGYIVKQLGVNRFIVAKGAITRTATLAQTAGEITAMATDTAGTLCTIEVTPFGGSTENVKKLTASRATTIQGTTTTWRLGTVAAAAAGESDLAKYTNASPTLATPAAKVLTTASGLTLLSFVAGADADGDVLSYRLIGTLPASGVVKVGSVVVPSLPYTVAASDLATISYTTGVAGSYSVVLEATDGVAVVTATSAITVS